MTTQIPPKLIGTLSKLIPNFYTHAEIDNLFFLAGAPEEIPEEFAKLKKTQTWLININKKIDDPLKVLSFIIEDFLEKKSKKHFRIQRTVKILNRHRIQYSKLSKSVVLHIGMVIYR